MRAARTVQDSTDPAAPSPADPRGEFVDLPISDASTDYQLHSAYTGVERFPLRATPGEDDEVAWWTIFGYDGELPLGSPALHLRLLGSFGIEVDESEFFLHLGFGARFRDALTDGGTTQWAVATSYELFLFIDSAELRVAEAEILLSLVTDFGTASLTFGPRWVNVQGSVRRGRASLRPEHNDLVGVVQASLGPVLLEFAYGFVHESFDFRIGLQRRL